MTASGSTVFALVTNMRLVKRKINQYRKDYDFVEVTSINL